MKHSKQSVAIKRQELLQNLQQEDLESVLDLMYFTQKDRKQEAAIIQATMHLVADYQ